MAFYYEEPSRTFNEYLLVPGHTPASCIPAKVDLKTPLVRYRKGQEECPISLNIPMVSAIMAAVSDDHMAVALATEGGISFIYGNQTIESEAAMVARVKAYKAGFVVSDTNLSPDTTLEEVVALKEQTGHSTMPVTDNGQAGGKLLGVVTERDYRLSRMSLDTKVSEFMTPRENLVVATEGTSLKEANDIIWDHKLNALPIVSADGHLVSFVFRKDYDSHKGNPLELLDSQKRYVVGAGINTRDYAERVPALLEAGLMYLSMKWGANISVMMPYADSLKLMSDWYAQLWAESLGKNVTLSGERVNVGQTPVKTLGVTDQHSQLQLYTEGPYDKVLTFLKVENFRATTPIPHGVEDIDTIAFLGGKSHNQLIEAERQGTEYALYKKGRMSQTITLPEVNAHTLGQLIFFYEMTTAYTGELLDIDAFNQPGVEESKIASYAVLGNTSEKYQKKAEEMKNRPAEQEAYIL